MGCAPHAGKPPVEGNMNRIPQLDAVVNQLKQGALGAPGFQGFSGY
jgi:hypothetical protein